MKKSLILLPLLALAVASCTIGGGGSKKRKSSSEPAPTTTAAPSDPTSEPTSHPTGLSTTATPTSEPGPTGISTTTPAPTSTPTSAPTSSGIPAFGEYHQIATEAEMKAGDDFLFGCYDENGQHVFLDGSMIATYYPSAQAKTVEAAIKFKVEASGKGYTIKATSGSVTGKYLTIAVSSDGAHVNASYSANPVVWEFVSADDHGNIANTVGVKVQQGDYDPQYEILAQQSGKQTLAPTYWKYWSTNAVGRLYTK